MDDQPQLVSLATSWSSDGSPPSSVTEVGCSVSSASSTDCGTQPSRVISSGDPWTAATAPPARATGNSRPDARYAPVGAESNAPTVTSALVP